MVHLFNRTIKNISHNFITHEIISCEDRDPPWISSIRRLIQDKNEVYKCFKRNNNNSQHFESFRFVQNLLKVYIQASKQKYYSRLSKKLMDSSTSPKTYWSVVKSFRNNKNIFTLIFFFFFSIFTKIDLLPISKKDPNYFILILLNSVQL